MNLELLIAIATQRANLINLVGSYLSQAAAELSFKFESQPELERLADMYNILGTQITTIASVIFCILGQLAIDLVIQSSLDTADDIEIVEPDVNENNDNSSSSTLNSGQVTVWRIKPKKKRKNRTWRLSQHYQANNS